MKTNKLTPSDAATNLSPQLERITITGIHGTARNIDVRLEDNTLIIVGENGSGKTTFLRLLFNLFSGNWISILQTKFDTAVIRLNGVDVEVKYSETKKKFETYDRKFLRAFPPSSRRSVQMLFESGAALADPDAIERLAIKHGIPSRYLYNQLNLFTDSDQSHDKGAPEVFQQLRAGLNAQILYLPTYRRIERELTSIFEGMESEGFRPQKLTQPNKEPSPYFVELVEFGMRDVERAVERTLSQLGCKYHLWQAVINLD